MAKSLMVLGSTIEQLEAIARSVFPMEIDAQLHVRDLGENKVVTDITLDYEDIDVRAFIYSENFKELTRCLKNNGVDEFELDRIKRIHRESKSLFKNYTECQRLRSIGECKSKSVQSSKCEPCSAYGQPRLPRLYGWFSNSPCIAWHSHGTSKYGNLYDLAQPSLADSRIVAGFLEKRIPILAEMITCTSERGKQETRLWALPDVGRFAKKIDRAEIPLN